MKHTITKKKHYLDGSCTTGGPDGLLIGRVLRVHEQIAFAEHIGPQGLGQCAHVQVFNAFLLRVTWNKNKQVQ